MNSPWSQSPDTVIESLRTSARSGLDEREVLLRREKHGWNRLPAHRGPSGLALLMSQFADWMVLLLAAAAILSALIGEVGDAALIALIVVANAVIGFAQEWKAEKAMDALQSLAQPHAEVLRGGLVQSIPADQVVPGDILRIRAGSAVPADCRILTAVEVEADEAALTGESLATEKQIAAVDTGAPLPDRACMLYSGTSVTRGHAMAVVTATGSESELGRIARLISTADEGLTPLQVRLNRLSGQLAILVLAVCLVILITGVIREPVDQWNRQLVSNMLLTAVSLAVAAIPEGLPAIVTVVLALGSQRMARRNAIVRRLSAVETLGSVNVICSDKTGTLTQNRMTVMDVIPSLNENPGDPTVAETGLLTAAVLCNNAEMDQEGRAIGSATEAALLTAAQTRLIDVTALQRRWQKYSELPFSSDRKRMSTLHRTAQGQSLVLVKGAVERVLERTVATGGLDAATLELHVAETPCDQNEWIDRASALARQGRRVLAVAARRWHADSLSTPGASDAEQDLVLLGLISIHDPVRPEAAESIARCRAAGIQTVMITGDHPETAQAIASQTGLLTETSTTMSGRELETLSEPELRSRLKTVTVFARVAPEHKLRIVRALQAEGAVVAMTGDGVNDAPALKQAEIGVAMGITGTDVARESSEMILADDNFATIVAAVEEGRVVYDNIRKFVAYLLTANTGEILVLFLAIVFGLPLPLLPAQILWINLVTDGLPALALGFERAERDVMSRKPASRNAGIFSRGLTWMVATIGSLMGLIALALFLSFYDPTEPESSLRTARTVVFTNLALSQLFYVLAIRSRRQSLWQLGLWSNYRLTIAVLTGIGLQGLLIYLPPLSRYFHTTPLSGPELALSAGMALIPFAILECWKMSGRRA